MVCMCRFNHDPELARALYGVPSPDDGDPVTDTGESEPEPDDVLVCGLELETWRSAEPLVGSVPGR